MVPFDNGKAGVPDSGVNGQNAHGVYRLTGGPGFCNPAGTQDRRLFATSSRWAAGTADGLGGLIIQDCSVGVFEVL